MTISSTVNRLAYTGNGSTTAFSVSFKFIDPEDLVLYVDDDLQVLDTDYTVSGGAGSTGTVTFSTAPVSAARITILRDPAVLQETDYSENDNFPAETHERALDRLTMIAQRNRDLLERSLTLSDSAPDGVSTQLPSPSANEVIAWNDDGTALVSKAVSDITTSIVGAQIVRDVFSGTGSQTDFVLSADPQVINNTYVFISGVYQQKSEYSLSGDTLVFDSAPPLGTNNVEVMQMEAVTYPVTAIATGAVGTDELGSQAVTTVKIANEAVTTAKFAADAKAPLAGLADEATQADNATTADTAGALSAGALSSASMIADSVITPAKLTQPLTIGTAQATTSGTFKDFAVPSWAKRITVSFDGVSTNGTSNIQIQIGSGSVSATGYVSGADNSAGSGVVTSTTGFLVSQQTAAATAWYGSAELSLQSESTNSWVSSSTMYSTAPRLNMAGGSKSLSGQISIVRVTTVNGTDAFDAGSVNIMYEG